MRHDYASMGFYTFDCLGWPVSAIPPNGDTFFIQDITLAVSGAAGAAVVAAAKLGLDCLAIGGYGRDMTGDWAVDRIASFGIDILGLQRFDDVPTSSSIVLTRADGSRPALHLKGATGAFACRISAALRAPSIASISPMPPKWNTRASLTRS